MVKAWRYLTILGVAACGGDDPEIAITGQLWVDSNGNGVRDADEAAVADVVVFANVEFDPSINSGDPVTRTDADGNYKLIVPSAGTFNVIARPPFGFRTATTQKPRATRPRARLIGNRSLAPIIGGREAADGQYNFMVAVGSPSGDLFLQNCGGTLIDDRHVLTAAHCSAGAQVADSGVLVGTLDAFGESTGQVFAVERITVNPKFITPTLGFDSAVWTLAEPVPLDDLGLTTVDMLDPDTAPLAAPAALATTIGWGVSDRDNRFLQQLHLPLVDPEDCSAAYPSSENFETQLCAGLLEGGIGPCFGDSGGPLMVRDEARQVWMQAGITSYGDGGCADPGAPAVFGRVSAMSEWVKATAAEEVTAPATVAAGELGTTLDFPLHATTRPQVGPIAERWQLTGFGLPSVVSADVSLDVPFGILGDATSVDGFSCHFQSDRAATGPIDDVACGIGTTHISLPTGFPTGIFVSSLTVSRADVSFTRLATVFAGAPTALTSSGALTAQDGIDPDYSSFASYHIDYYDVGTLTGTKAFAIDAKSAAFSMFLVLYDLDQRDFVTGGGAIQIATPDFTGKARIVVVPDGRHYAIGVSSLDENETGAYTVSILNDGTLTPH